LLVALLWLGGCATFRDIKNDLSNSSLRRGGKQPWSRRSPDEFDALADRRPGRIIGRDFNPRNLPTTFKVITAIGENQTKAQSAFDRGMALYNDATEQRQAGNESRAASTFHDAANRFREAGAYWPDSALEQDALFMQGEAFFFADQYVLANRAYEALAAQYSGTHYMDHVNARRFAIAQFWLQTVDAGGPKTWLNVSDKMLPASNVSGEARRIFHRIRLDDPTGKLADDATIALGKALYKSKRWTEAAETFEDLRTSYPASKFQFDAHLLEINARLASYAGPDYDGTPLKKADELLRAVVRQFPQDVQKHRDYLDAEADRVQNMLAQRDFNVGQYYEGRGENRAASMYYDMVAQRFGQTTVGDEAQQRIAQLAEKPAEPVQPAAWFVELFPEPEATKPLIASGTPGTVFR
jgi:outer membrane assembly lipoprotein YfiO